MESQPKGDEDAAPAPEEGELLGERRRWLGMTWVRCMALGALAAVALIVGGAGAMVALEVNTGTQQARTPCEYEALGYDPELGAKPWSLKSPSSMGMIYLSGLFLLRRHVFPRLVEALVPQHTAAKKEKVANYILEILLCTTGLLLISVCGVWDLLFNPPETRDTDPERANSIAVAAYTSFPLIVCTYILELSFDRGMRFELQVHHYLTIYLAIHSTFAGGALGLNLPMARLCLSFSLFIFTEGPVFVMLFVYQLKFYQWVIYELLAYYYAISRFFVIAIIYWAWWDVQESVFEIYDHNNFIAYSIFLVAPIGVFFLLLTQFTAIVNLFGISRRVRGLRQQRQVRARWSKIFMNMGESPAHGLSLEEWMAKVGNVVHGVAVPEGGLTTIFQKMDSNSCGLVNEVDFVDFFGSLTTNASEDSELLRIALLLAFLQDDEEEAAGGEARYAIMTELRGALEPTLSTTGKGRGRRFTVDEYIERKLADGRKHCRGARKTTTMISAF